MPKPTGRSGALPALAFLPDRRARSPCAPYGLASNHRDFSGPPAPAPWCRNRSSIGQRPRQERAETKSAGRLAGLAGIIGRARASRLERRCQTLRPITPAGLTLRPGPGRDAGGQGGVAGRGAPIRTQNLHPEHDLVASVSLAAVGSASMEDTVEIRLGPRTVGRCGHG